MLILGQPFFKRLALFIFDMPVHLDESGKCVVEPSGKTIKCHETHKQALAHMRAINANVEHKSLSLHKDKDGKWNWLGIVTNSWMDREKDILISDAHRKFVTAIDSGIYKDFFGKDAPDLWIWHLPVPVGKTTNVAYDERGFLIAAGVGLEGEFYDKVFSAIAKKEAREPGHFGMSHGMPPEFLREGESIPGVDHNLIISSYMSEEFSFLPLERAANLGTAMGGVMLKEDKSRYLEVDESKEEWFIDVFGDDTVAEFGSRLDEIGIALNVAGVPNKELDSMKDSTDVQETVAEETLAEEVVEESTVEDKATTAEEEEEEVKAASEEQEDDDMEEEDAEKEFVTSKDLRLVVAEIVKGVAEPVQQIRAEFDALKAELADVRKDVESMRVSEDLRVTEKATEMPQASLSSVIARTIVGQEGARIDYNKERTLHQAGPEESDGDPLGEIGTGIPSIDALIKEQRAKRKVVAYTGGQ